METKHTKKTNFFLRLIMRNTGTSSKSFVMVVGVIAIVAQMLVVDVIVFISINASKMIDWLGIAALYTALSTLAAALIWGKVKGDQYDSQNLPSEPDNKPEI